MPRGVAAGDRVRTWDGRPVRQRTIVVSPARPAGPWAPPAEEPWAAGASVKLRCGFPLAGGAVIEAGETATVLAAGWDVRDPVWVVDASTGRRREAVVENTPYYRRLGIDPMELEAVMRAGGGEDEDENERGAPQNPPGSTGGGGDTTGRGSAQTDEVLVGDAAAAAAVAAGVAMEARPRQAAAAASVRASYTVRFTDTNTRADVPESDLHSEYLYLSRDVDPNEWFLAEKADVVRRAATMVVDLYTPGTGVLHEGVDVDAITVTRSTRPLAQRRRVVQSIGRASSVAALLREGLRVYADFPCVTDGVVGSSDTAPPRWVSYSGAEAYVNRILPHLPPPGAAVVVCGPLSLPHYCVYLAALVRENVLVPVLPRRGDAYIAHVLRDTQPAMVVVDTDSEALRWRAAWHSGGAGPFNNPRDAEEERAQQAEIYPHPRAREIQTLTFDTVNAWMQEVGEGGGGAGVGKGGACEREGAGGASEDVADVDADADTMLETDCSIPKPMSVMMSPVAAAFGRAVFGTFTAADGVQAVAGAAAPAAASRVPACTTNVIGSRAPPPTTTPQPFLLRLEGVVPGVGTVGWWYVRGRVPVEVAVDIVRNHDDDDGVDVDADVDAACTPNSTAPAATSPAPASAAAAPATADNADGRTSKARAAVVTGPLTPKSMEALTLRAVSSGRRRGTDRDDDDGGIVILRRNASPAAEESGSGDGSRGRAGAAGQHEHALGRGPDSCASSSSRTGAGGVHAAFGFAGVLGVRGDDTCAAVGRDAGHHHIHPQALPPGRYTLTAATPAAEATWFAAAAGGRSDGPRDAGREVLATNEDDGKIAREGCEDDHDPPCPLCREPTAPLASGVHIRVLCMECTYVIKPSATRARGCLTCGVAVCGGCLEDAAAAQRAVRSFSGIDVGQEDAMDDTQRTCMILYTSGSTGTPKGAVWPTRAARHECQRSLATSSVDKVALLGDPMAVSSNPHKVMTSIAEGGRVALTNAPSEVDIAELVGPTGIGCVPLEITSLHRRYREELGGEVGDAHTSVPAGVVPPPTPIDQRKVVVDARFRRMLGPRLRHFNSGGAAADPAAMRWLRQLLRHCDVTENYAATETGPIAYAVGARSAGVDGAAPPPPPAMELDAECEYRLRAWGDYTPEDKPFPRGELVVRTRAMIAGYLNRSDLDAAAFDADGFYSTGDIVELQPSSGTAALDVAAAVARGDLRRPRVRVIDRKHAVFKLANGEFVAPATVESCLLSVPAVRQAVVFGSSREPFVVAVVVPTASAPYPSTTGTPAPVAEDGAGRSEGTGDACATGVAAAVPTTRTTLADERDRITALCADACRRAGLRDHEIPVAVHVETDPEGFTAGNSLLTATGKLARAALKAKYSASVLPQLFTRGRAVYARREDTVVAGVVAMARVALQTGHPPASQTPRHLPNPITSIQAVQISCALRVALGVHIPPGFFLRVPPPSGGAFAAAIRGGGLGDVLSMDGDGDGGFTFNDVRRDVDDALAALRGRGVSAFECPAPTASASSSRSPLASTAAKVGGGVGARAAPRIGIAVAGASGFLGSAIVRCLMHANDASAAASVTTPTTPAPPCNASSRGAPPPPPPPPQPDTHPSYDIIPLVRSAARYEHAMRRAGCEGPLPAPVVVGSTRGGWLRVVVAGRRADEGNDGTAAHERPGGDLEGANVMEALAEEDDGDERNTVRVEDLHNGEGKDGDAAVAEPPAAAYTALARRVDVVINAAAEVNFLKPYAAMKAANVFLTGALLALARDASDLRRGATMLPGHTASPAPPDAGSESDDSPRDTLPPRPASNNAHGKNASVEPLHTVPVIHVSTDGLSELQTRGSQQPLPTTTPAGSRTSHTAGNAGGRGVPVFPSPSACCAWVVDDGGYHQSKAVAECIVEHARCDHGIPTCIVRPGMIGPDVATGMCNTQDWLTRYVAGVLAAGVYAVADVGAHGACPRLHLSCVGYTASAVVALARRAVEEQRTGPAAGAGTAPGGDGGPGVGGVRRVGVMGNDASERSTPIHHIPTSPIGVREFMAHVEAAAAGVDRSPSTPTPSTLRLVSPAAWRAAVDALPPANPLYPLRSTFRDGLAGMNAPLYPAPGRVLAMSSTDAPPPHYTAEAVARAVQWLREWGWCET